MKSQANQTGPPNCWNRMVHAPFKKVVAFDLLFMALGMPIGAGIITAILIG